MNLFELSSEAQLDVQRIRRFSIQQWGVAQTDNYLKTLKGSFALLADNPKLGVHRPDVKEGVHSFPCQSHIIYYVAKEKKIIIFAVLHKHMSPKQHLPERSPS